MIHSDARRIVEKILFLEFGKEEYEVIIDDENSFEFSRGWFFFYNTVAFVKYQDDINCLFVTSPIIIDKLDGKIYRLRGKLNAIRTAEVVVDEYVSGKENPPLSDSFREYDEIEINQ